ncbi:probable WRKY transcription factor 24 [Ziziphus jujuba]|uniref:WRKY domain-containing protein n=2 Tax=Ziziphus jujuba TaxID=326968 RepID=A0A978UGD8_ZIZJJ|nr:probable WRKY transcription factor 24 [Ziziphus jujuba]KAH7513869.1 hypothetical protein FEM48_Zijuj11G0028300 [Ziziphus jujuba var. spinosa]
MDEEIQPDLLPSSFIPDITLPLVPSTSMNLLSDPLHQLTQESDQIANSDIDWISLLCGSTKYDDQNPAPSSPIVSIKAKSENKGENHGNKNKEKVTRSTKKAIPPRIAFHTRSADDILDDGYRWRKYGQKSVKKNNNPRSYYRCCHHTCNVKKQIQRLSKDSSIVVTTYEGIHNHPCEKLMESLTPLLKQLQFLSRFQHLEPVHSCHGQQL